MENTNVTFEVKVRDEILTATLRQPKFDEYRMAVMASQSQSGVVDKLAAGKQLVVFCWVEGSETLKFGHESKDFMLQKAYATLCLEVCDELLTFCHTEVKKN